MIIWSKIKGFLYRNFLIENILNKSVDNISDFKKELLKLLI